MIDLEGWFASGGAIDVVLVVIAVEAVMLIRRRGHRSVPDALLPLLPGVLLLLALRAALTGAPWWMVALWLTASFPAHLADLWRRRR